MKLLLILALCVSTAFPQGTKSKPDTLPDRKIDAKALIDDILGRSPTSAMEILGLLKMRDEKGKYREVPIRWTTRPGNGDWNDIYQTPEGGKTPPEQLTIIHREGATNHYIFKRAGQDVTLTNLFVPFGTSDFWLADFGLEFLHWPNPKHLKTEMRNHRACFVIESQNPSPAPAAYSRVVSWIDTEQGGLVRAEAFDGRNKMLKEFSIRGFRRVEGQWKIKSLEIRNDQTDTRTTLEFDYEVAVQKKESDSP